MIFAACLKFQRTVDNIQEALCQCLTAFPSTFYFGCVLRERSAKIRANVNDGGPGFHPRQGRPHKSIGSEQEMIALVSAASVAEIMHDWPSFYIPVRQQVDPTNGDRI